MARITSVVVLLAFATAPLAAQGGVAAELDSLRAEARAHPDSFPIALALGLDLARASSERLDEWQLRAEAHEALDRAVRMRPSDPRPLLGMGLLLRKQGSRVDGLRVLKRAEDRASASGVAMTPTERAELHLQMALIYEVWWEDNENLGLLPEAFAVGSCPHLASFYPPGAVIPTLPRQNLLIYNVACPDVFDALMEYWYVPDGQGEDDYDAMVRHYRAAIEADPGHTVAARRLLRHLAAGRLWEEFLAVAEPLARRRPTDPDVLLFLGMAYHEAGRREQADSVFRLAVEYAGPDLRRDMLEPEQLMRRTDSIAFGTLPAQRQEALTEVFWRARDPLFLSSENERLAEHLARLAYVEIAYSAPQSGLRGRWSARGAAWLRWGRPLQIRAIRGADSRFLEFWDYGKGSPDLVFERQRTYRWARHEELSAEYVRYARDVAPELYVPEHPRMVAKAQFQAAAFRDTAGAVALEIYAAVPVGVLSDSSDLPFIEAGIFIASGDYWEMQAALPHSLPRGVGDESLDATFSLSPGSYVVSVEAAVGDVAATRRHRVELPAFGDSLALSDLLLTERFGSDALQVDDRRALAPVVSRTQVFPIGAPIGVLWEVYGLRPDSAGVARYAVKAEVSNEKQESAPVRLLRGLFGRGEGPGGAEWSASRVPRPDGAIVEFVTLDLSTDRPESYRIFITVTDLVTTRSVTVHRAFATGSP